MLHNPNQRLLLYEKILGSPLTDQQKEVDDAVCRGDRKILVRAANGIGKTSFIAALAIVELFSNDDITIVVTSKTHTHLRRNFWANFRRYLKNLPDAHATDKVPAGHYSPSAGRLIVGISPNSVENAQGYHSAKVLVLVDEASGVSSEIFEALISNMTGDHSTFLAVYNPINTDGFVYSAEKSGAFTTIALSGMEHPNVVLGYEAIPGAITQKFITDLLYIHSKPCDASHPQATYIPWLGTYFEKTGQIAIRVFGEFSEISHDGFIEPELLDSSILSDRIIKPIGIPYIGIDISRGLLDKTVASEYYYDNHLKTLNLYGFHEFTDRNLSVLAGKIYERYEHCYIGIDDTGLGAGVTDRLTHLGHNRISPINFGSSPRNFYRGQAQPSNAITEMFLLFENDLRRGRLKIPRSLQLFRELTVAKVEPVYGGRMVKLSSKRKLRQKLSGRSPDYADSAMLGLYCFYINKSLNFNLFQ